MNIIFILIATIVFIIVGDGLLVFSLVFFLFLLSSAEDA